MKGPCQEDLQMAQKAKEQSAQMTRRDSLSEGEGFFLGGRVGGWSLVMNNGKAVSGGRCWGSSVVSSGRDSESESS